MTRERDRRSDAGEDRANASGIAAGKRTLSEALPVQRKSAPGGGLPFMDVMLKSANAQETASAGVAGAAKTLPHLDRIQASFGSAHDLSSVRADVGGAAGAAAAGIGAEAYATGDRVAFQRAPDVHTAAHEAAHVVQQRSGVVSSGVGSEGDAHERQADAIADRVVQGASSADLLPGGAASQATSNAVQLRRVPAGDVAPLVESKPFHDEPANLDAHRAGLKLVIQRAEENLRARDARDGTELYKSYMKEALKDLPRDEIVEPGELMIRKTAALKVIAPELALGDPTLVESGARRGTADKANLRKLVKNAGKIFEEIASGSRDSDIEDVFGAGNVATAKRKYAKAYRELKSMRRDDEILSDRSGFSGEVGLGGYASYHDRIVLMPEAIDNPDEAGSIRIAIHEAMHAGNADVHDSGNYIGSGDAFKSEAASIKLTNAAHFEVVPRRILKLEPTFTGEKFVPAGTTSGGVTAPPLTAAMKAQKACATELREAWSHAIDVAGFVRDVKVKPRLWTRYLDAKRYSTVLRFWSKLMALTIHEKATIVPRSRDQAKLPVSDIDMALVEGVCRRLRNAKGMLPGNEAELTKFEEDNSTAAERTAAHASVDAHHAFLKRLVLGLPNVGPITGDLAGDVNLVTELGTRTWAQILNPAGSDDADDDDDGRARQGRDLPEPHHHEAPQGAG